MTIADPHGKRHDLAGWCGRLVDRGPVDRVVDRGIVDRRERCVLRALRSAGIQARMESMGVPSLHIRNGRPFGA